MNNKRQHILKWHQQGHIAEKDLERALHLTKSHQSNQQWYAFIRQSLLWLGIISAACGIIFFFAYNWSNLSTYAKFAIIQILMVATILTYSQNQTHTYISTALLCFLTLLIGSLFALFGQIYQSGKDPWQLFALWALFATPLAFSSKSSVLWLLWLALCNLALLLYLDVYYGFWGLIFDGQAFAMCFIALNIIALIIMEFLHHKGRLFSRVSAQIAALAAACAFTAFIVNTIFDSETKLQNFLYYGLWMSALYYAYRIRHVDALLLSAWLISGIIFIVALLISALDSSWDGAAFLLISALIIGLSTAGIKWLMSVVKQSSNQGEVA